MNTPLKSSAKVRDNVEIRVTDANGKAKLMFNENALGRWFLKQVRKVTPESSYIHKYGIRIPVLMGMYGYSKALSNGITNAGRAVVSARLYGTASAAYGAIGMGTGTTAFSATQTALVTGVKGDGTADSGVHALATASVTASSITTTVTNDTAQFTGTVSITATIAVTESGLFNADTNGTMLARQTFSAVNVVNGDSLTLTWKIQNA